MSPVEVLEAYADAWNAHDVKAISDLYAPEAVRVSPLGAVEGRVAIRSYVEAFFAMSPDTSIEIGRHSSTASEVFYEFVDEGTQLGALRTAGGELPASGRRFHIEGSGIIAVADGQMCHDRVYFDVATLMRQLNQ